MNKIRKRLLSILLVLCMVIGVIPFDFMETVEVSAATTTRNVYLSDLQWQSATKGSNDNAIQLNKAYAGGTLTLLDAAGQNITYSKGIGTHATSEIVYNVENKKYTRFESFVGVDQSRLQYYNNPSYGTRYGVVSGFKVLIDGIEVFNSGEMNPSTAAQKVDVVIPSTAKEVKLVVGSGTDTWSDHANWADAKFTQTLPDPTNVALNKQPSVKKTVDNTQAPVNPDSSVSSAKMVDGIKNSSTNYFDFGNQASSGATRESLYVQIDLGKSYELTGINMWRYWLDARTYDATAVVISNDATFADQSTKVIYNSDTANVHGLSASGTDAKYQETSAGKSFAVATGTLARYIRVYTYGVLNGGVTNHIVELEVNAYVFPESTTTSGKVFENALQPLNIICPPGTDNNSTHPDVIVFPNTWNGYKYWMGFTPNMSGSSYYENPCIVASNDGENWVVPVGLSNPVQPRFDSQVVNELEHNCDTDLLYDTKNDRLVLYWEWARDEGVKESEVRYRVSYDGLKWGKPITGQRDVTQGNQEYGVAIHTAGSRYTDLSPTVVYDKTADIYKMWATDAGDVGYNNNTNNKVWYRTSADGLSNWSEKTWVNNYLGLDENGKQLYPWHQDIQYIDEFGEYWALQQAFPAGTNPNSSSLRYAKSTDGINWTPVSTLPLVTRGASGQWDEGQIYRSTFYYEPAASGVKGLGTFHIWYAGLSAGNRNWHIGYTSNSYVNVMAGLTGTKPEVPLRKLVNNENPLLVMPLYGKSYSDAGSVLDWGDDLVSRWNAVPNDLKGNAVIELHVGGKIGLNETDGATAKKFYEQQLQIAQANNIPVVIVVATAGLKPYWTGTAGLTPEWTDTLFKKYSCLIGTMSTENYWTDYGAVATASARYLEVAAQNGGYYMWSEHQKSVIESVVSNASFKEKLLTYGNNFIFTFKNTPANAYQNAGTDSYMKGLWLTGIIAQWGGLMDTWKWYEKGYWKLFDQNSRPSTGTSGEEARPVATEPEALLGIEMMNIYLNGGTVYNFEHPAYVYGVYNQNSHVFEDVVAKFMRYAIANPAPTKQEVIDSTKAVVYGNLSQLGNFYSGLNCEDESLPTYTTGRYSIIPAVPSSIPVDRVNTTFTNATILTNSSAQLATKAAKVAFFENLYPANYTGSAFAQLLKGSWYLYNNKVNVNENQNAKMTLTDTTKSIDVTMEPHTYVILKETNGILNVNLNNYRVNKDSIWQGYGLGSTRWDTDHNTLLQDWIRDIYIPNPDDNTMRITTMRLNGLTSAPTISVVRGLEGQYVQPVVNYNSSTGEALVTVSNNGWLEFGINLNGN